MLNRCAQHPRERLRSTDLNDRIPIVFQFNAGGTGGAHCPTDLGALFPNSSSDSAAVNTVGYLNWNRNGPRKYHISSSQISCKAPVVGLAPPYAGCIRVFIKADAEISNDGKLMSMNATAEGHGLSDESGTGTVLWTQSQIVDLVHFR
jgi:hypothetical protein